MSNDAVSFVVATYNRPDTLAIALRSVQQQTEAGWQVLVIGDACSAETAEVVNTMADPRIKYINLDKRFGHQSGPNAVGGLLARTPLLAYLNHDDILLSDHLARARASLRQGGDFFVGAALFAESNSPEAAASEVPLFLEVSRRDMTASDAFDIGSNLFEPASAWVFDRNLIERAGNWIHPRATHRYPLQDFIMRMWRAGARFKFGDVPTVLKIVTFSGAKEAGGTYAVASHQHRVLAARLEGKSADDQRRIALAGAAPQQVSRGRNRASPVSRAVDRLLFCSAARSLYLATGMDSVAIYRNLVGRTPGTSYDQAVVRRTSQALPPADGYAQPDCRGGRSGAFRRTIPRHRGPSDAYAGWKSSATPLMQ